MLQVSRGLYAIFALGAGLSCCHGLAYAEADRHLLMNQRWDGLATLAAIAREEEVLLVSKRVDESPPPSLLIISLTSSLSVHGIRSFVSSGGRVAIVDDRASTTSLFNEFEIVATPIQPGSMLHVRDHSRWFLAQPHGSTHPLAAGIEAIISNRPLQMGHRLLEPVFSFGPQGGALVLTGAVDSGRLVFLSDPSILINGMLRFKGNRFFAKNLLRYLSLNGTRPIRVLTGMDSYHDHDSTRIAGSTSRHIKRMLQKASHAPLSPNAIRLIVISWMVLIVLVMLGHIRFTKDLEFSTQASEQQGAIDLVLGIEHEFSRIVRNSGVGREVSLVDSVKNLPLRQEDRELVNRFLRTASRFRKRRSRSLPVVFRKTKLRRFLKQSATLLRVLEDIPEKRKGS